LVANCDSAGKYEFRSTRIKSVGPICFQNNGNDFYDIRLTHQEDRERVPNSSSAYHREVVCEGESSTVVSRIYSPWGSSVIRSNGRDPCVQRQGDLLLSVDLKGRHQASQLGLGESGDVILGTLRDDGVMSAEMVTRLPSWAIEGREASLLNAANDRSSRNSSGSAAIKVLISPADMPFKQYHMSSTQQARARDTNSPMIICRKRKTIPTKVVHTNAVLGDSVDLVREARKRLCYTGSHHRP
jgi:hypothetical protein